MPIFDPDRRGDDARISEIQTACEQIKEDYHSLVTRVAMVEQRQELGERRTEKFEVAMHEAHNVIHREIRDLRDETKGMLSEFRNETRTGFERFEAAFDEHTKEEHQDRRAIMMWLAGVILALVLQGVGLFQWLFDKVTP
jgi:hypothetical protein